MVEGSSDGAVMAVGEEPGDGEDIAGRPFVGPAGVVLDRALELASLPRSTVCVTNVVKHFLYTERGRRRIHERPTRPSRGRERLDTHTPPAGKCRSTHTKRQTAAVRL